MSPLDAWVAGRLGEPLTRRALESRQLELLKQTVAWAAQASPFYRQHLRGIAPDRLVSLAQVASLPFTTPVDLREQGERFLCLSQSQLARVVTLPSSGTSGPAKRIFFTPEDLQGTVEFFHHGMATFTRPGEKVLILLPCTRPHGVGDLLAQALERLGARALPHGPVRDPVQTMRYLLEQEASCLVGSPVQVLSLLRGGGAAQVPPGLVRSVLLSTDYVPLAVTRALEKGWGCRVYAHWGLTESGLGGGVECEARQGCHLREADLYVEVIDPASGFPLPEGRTGEVVLTTLTRRGMPLIRYRTGDLAALMPGACPCGSALKRLGKVVARIGGVAAVGGGQTLTIAELDEALFPLPGLLDYMAALTRGSDGEMLEVCLIPGAALPAERLLERAGQALRQLLDHKLVRQAKPQLRLTLGSPGGALPEGLVKRTLADRRGELA
jgi:phenylacetate-coenzyme A ligase PaaK-like adenylate-forming protein